jgi:hypothetical protein
MNANTTHTIVMLMLTVSTKRDRTAVGVMQAILGMEMSVMMSTSALLVWTNAVKTQSALIRIVVIRADVIRDTRRLKTSTCVVISMNAQSNLTHATLMQSVSIHQDLIAVNVVLVSMGMASLVQVYN